MSDLPKIDVIIPAYKAQNTILRTLSSIAEQEILEDLEVTIPENCVLKFNGGSIKNGTIKGDRTSFASMQNDCLLCDFSGTFEAQYINAK